jgi:hypothetical protein
MILEVEMDIDRHDNLIKAARLAGYNETAAKKIVESIYRQEALQDIWEADLRTMGEQREEIASLKLWLTTLAQYAVHLGNCTFFQDGDVCTCGLAAFSDLMDPL